MTRLLRHLVPLFALALVPLAAQAQGADTASFHRHSWTSDRRDFREGDIITVLVDESTLASASKGQSGSDQQTRTNNLGLPAVGPLAMGIDVNVATGKKSASSQSGNATRDMKFRGEMTVRVVKVASNGVLEIKGARTVDVDKNKQQLTLTGFVRPEDVSHDNTVASVRVADAQVLYTLTGDLGGTRGGILGRIISVFWP